jgi:hypothetical protein
MNRNAIFADFLLLMLPTVAIANPYPSAPYAQYTGLFVETVLITVILGVKGFNPLRFFYSWGLVTTSTFLLLVGWINTIEWLVPMSRRDDWWFIVLPLLIGEIGVVLIEALVLQRLTLISFFRRKTVAPLTLSQALRYSTVVNVMSFLAGS